MLRSFPRIAREMLQCAQKCSRSKSSMSLLSPGELFYLASELQICCDHGITLPGQLFSNGDKNEQSKEKTRNMSR
ncbi:hypothetical protein WDU94_009400 [Cyamophila willieti]